MAKVSLLARAVRAAITPRTSSTAFAAVDVAGGGRRISAFVPRRDLTGDASSNGVDMPSTGAIPLQVMVISFS
jgi:hypothetical protein